MRKWFLKCSVDCSQVDYEEVIESEKEPDIWTCTHIAEEHGCKWWSLEEVIQRSTGRV